MVTGEVAVVLEAADSAVIRSLPLPYGFDTDTGATEVINEYLRGQFVS